MSDPQQNPWSNNPNAPMIPYGLHYREKNNMIGNLLTAIFYGITIIVFFECMTALFNPVYRRGDRVKWGLISYTVAIFSSLAIHNAVVFKIQSICYIDNRNFPGGDGGLPPGPLGCQLFTDSGALNLIAYITFLFNGSLADGLLLYRCYVICSKNVWVVAFPCLMYLGSVAVSIMLVYKETKTTQITDETLSYLSLSASLNVLLTLMIVIRLILHTRNIRNAMGISGIGRMCNAISTMLIESCALYTVSTLLVIIPLAVDNYVMDIFFPILAETQVIASLLIIQRVANKSALTSNTVASGRLSDFKAKSRGQLTTGNGTLPGGGAPMSPVDERGTNSGELGVGMTTIDVHGEEAQGSSKLDAFQ